jgi:partner of Y14 and mago
MAPSQSTEPANSAVTKSGITTSASGDRVIPASTRADGSQRREIRVRPGYRPPEDVEVYKNRTAEAWKTRGNGGVPGADGLQEDEGKTADAKSKNAKRREARKRAKAAAETEEGGVEVQQEEEGVNGNTKAPRSTAATAPVANSEEKARADDEKKVKRLKKKLREARELQAKKEKGEGLLHEQFEKVIKINELLRELEKLGVTDEEAEAAPA